MIHFVPITKCQHDEMMKEYIRCGAYTITKYHEKLLHFLNENNEEMIVVFCADKKLFHHGFIIALYDDIKDLEGNLFTKINGLCSDIYKMELYKHNKDFDLPSNLVSIFRGYVWPFKKFLNDSHFELMRDTFKNKGLVRHCCIHYGNFEMIGKRRSFQSNGFLIVDLQNVIDHQYYRDTMNENTLPYVKSIIIFYKRKQYIQITLWGNHSCHYTNIYWV